MNKEDVLKEMKKYEQIRQEFYGFLDENVPKDGMQNFDFNSNPTLEAKAVYERFYKLDYQARKLRALLIDAYDIKVG